MHDLNLVGKVDLFILTFCMFFLTFDLLEGLLVFLDLKQQILSFRLKRVYFLVELLNMLLELSLVLHEELVHNLIYNVPVNLALSHFKQSLDGVRLLDLGLVEVLVHHLQQRKDQFVWVRHQTLLNRQLHILGHLTSTKREASHAWWVHHGDMPFGGTCEVLMTGVCSRCRNLGTCFKVKLSCMAFHSLGNCWAAVEVRLLCLA